MLRSHLLASAALLPFLPTVGLAQQAFDLGEVVLSGSLSPVARDQTGASVEVLDRAALQGSDTSVIERLDRLPGVSFSANGGLGANATLRLRGLPGRYVMVRVNGIDMNDPSGTQNSYNFGSLLPQGIDRVEVLKGSQSALYGSEAIGGVIDITTYRPEEMGVSGSVSGELGSNNTRAATLNLGLLTERAEVALTYGRALTDGFSARAGDDEDDGFRQTTATLTGRYDLTDSVTIGAALTARDGELELDRSSSDNTGQISFEERGARVYADVQTGNVSHTFAYSHFDIERRDPTGFTTLFQGERKRFSYLGSAELGGETTLNFGLDRTEESFNSGGTTGDEDTVSAQAELLLRPRGDLDLSLALRHDDNSDFGGKTTGRLAAVWRVQPDLALRAVVGTGFRAPSLYERFSFYGDPDLQPEESRSFELGVEKTYGEVATVKATLFYTEIDDLIQYDGAATACGSGWGCYNQVPGTTKSRGIELSGDYALSARTTLYGSYTYTDATTDGERLTRTPKHDLVLGVDTEITDRLQASFDVQHVGDVVPSAFAPADNKVGTYTLVGAGLTYDVNDSTQAYLRIENLFDEDYETAGGYNTPGRSAFFGVRADF